MTDEQVEDAVLAVLGGVAVAFVVLAWWLAQ
jgi:hypothetical protein